MPLQQPAQPDERRGRCEQPPRGAGGAIGSAAHGHGRLAHAGSGHGQAGEIGHAVHRHVQALQQALAVQAQVQLLGVDHHVVEERIHGRAQHGQCLQAGRVVARGEERIGLGHETLQGRIQVLLGLLPQQVGIDVRIHVAGLLQDVGDALVGRGERRGLGQRSEGAHGGELLRHQGQALRAQGQHGIDFLGAVALLAQAAGEAVVDEVGQRRGRVLDLVAEGGQRAVQQGFQVEWELFLDQHADHAQCVAAQGERIAVARGQVADAEHAHQGLELVGQRHHHARVAARQGVAREAGLVVVLDGIGHFGGQAVGLGVVAAHGALQFREFAHHVGDEVGLGELRGLVGMAGQLHVADLLGDGPGNGAHALHALALGAQLVVIDHPGQRGHAGFERLLAVLIEEELGIGQARAHHALVAAHHGARVVGADVADHQEAVRETAFGIEQREVLLVGLHREDEAFLRHVEELLLELAHQHIGPFDQRRDLVEQRIVFDGPHAAAHALGSRLQLAGDLGAAIGECGDDCALLGQLLRVGVGAADDHRVHGRLEAVAVGGIAGREAQHRDGQQHLGAVQRHEAVRGAHETHAGPARLFAARGELVAHHLGDGQFRHGFLQGLLQPFGQGRAAHGAVQEQGLGLAVGRTAQAGHGRRVGAQGSELLEQRGRGIAGCVQAHRDGHELLRDGLVGCLRCDFGDVGGQAPGRGIGRQARCGGGEALGLQLREQHAGEGVAELLQGLRGQLFDEQFNEKIRMGHGGVSRSAVPAPSGGVLLLRWLLSGLGDVGQHFVGPGTGRHGEAQARAAVQVAAGHGAREVADAADVGGALGHGNGAARIQQVEAVRGLEHLLVGGQRELLAHEVLRLLLVRREGGEEEVGVGMLEVVGGLLHLVLVIDVAVLEGIGPGEVIDVVHALQVHGQALQAVGDLARGRLAVDAAHLLEIGELRHLHAIEPDLPAQAPGAERGVLPVVLDEPDVVLLQVEAQRLERAQVQLQDVVRRGLEHHLILVVVLQAVRVLSVAAVLGPAAGLHVGGLPGLRPQRAQEGRGVRGARPHFHVVGLQERAALGVPVRLQLQDDLLEGQHACVSWRPGGCKPSARARGLGGWSRSARNRGFYGAGLPRLHPGWRRIRQHARQCAPRDADGLAFTAEGRTDIFRKTEFDTDYLQAISWIPAEAAVPALPSPHPCTTTFPPRGAVTRGQPRR